MITVYLFLMVLMALTTLPVLYLLLTTVASFFFRKDCSETNRFLNIIVLIPAHNEGEAIIKTVENVYKCDYPANRLEVIVIADNCSDDTAEHARNTGAIVFERTDTLNRGKGQALDWFLKTHIDSYQSADAITIVDADVTPDINYLREMSASFSNPEVTIVQGYNGVHNATAGWRPALIDAAFNVFNHLRLAGLFILTGSASLKGNGMAFKTSLLKHYGWPCHSIVEDLEFSLRLLQEGIAVHYNPDAVITSEMVTKGANATSQRSRWEGGRFTLVKNMTGPLLKRFVNTGHLKFLFAWADLALPPLGLLGLFVIPGTIAGHFLGGSWSILAVLYWLVILLYLLSGQIQRKAPVSTWVSLVAAPIYILWKIPIYISMLLKKPENGWIRTTRETN